MSSSTSGVRFSLKAGFVSLLALASLFAAEPSDAAVLNGGFETGNFTGWEILGRTSIKTSAYGSGPTEGTSQALLSTFCPTLVNNLCKQDGNFLELTEFLNVNALDLTTLGNVFEGSAIKTTLAVEAGDVLTFDWNFLTNSMNGDTSGLYNDFAFVTIAEKADKLSDTFSPFVGNVTGIDFEHQTGFKTFSYSFTTTGTYTLGIGVADVGDGASDSGLLVDNVLLSSTPIPSRVPEPTSILGVLTFGVFGIGLRRSRRH
jgi:hypothetical protein